ncbi:MAG: SDR family NAD(P)-dependent oxidoreductase [Candidatus Poseidonia sp.]|nr:SDR family NAD(P)-dependent oxidoreductase [Poseidonia sp.]
MNPQTYLITGASRGIGQALSLHLAKNGFRVILLARKSEALDSTTTDVQALSPTSFQTSCDLADSTSIARAVEQILDNVDRIDGLIHNAGTIAPIKPMLEAAGDDWARSIQVNLIGVQQLTAGLTTLLLGEHRVRVSTISSGASLRPLGSWSAYCTAKAGLDMWTRCLAHEGADENISAIAVAPGIVDTGMQVDIRSAPEEDFPLRSTFASYHADGDLTDPMEVAQQLFFLLTEHPMEQSGQRFDVRDL